MESGEDDGDKGGRESYMKFAKVMERMIGMLYEVCEGGKLWRSHSVKRDVQARRERTVRVAERCSTTGGVWGEVLGGVWGAVRRASRVGEAS